MIRIAPSLLAADFGSLAEQVGEVASEADLLHLDVMDGHFVPNLTIGPPVVSSLRKHTSMYFDCHLMVERPIEYFKPFKEAGADSITFHAEVGGCEEAIASLRELGLGVGLALNPDTPFSMAEPYLDKIDMLLIMSVFPGFGGQTFMPEVLPKIALAKSEISKSKLEVSIEVDGGIDINSARYAARAGADTFVAGTAIFRQDRPWEAARKIRNVVLQALNESEVSEHDSNFKVPTGIEINLEGSDPGASRENSDGKGAISGIC